MPPYGEREGSLLILFTELMFLRTRMAFNPRFLPRSFNYAGNTKSGVEAVPLIYQKFWQIKNSNYRGGFRGDIFLEPTRPIVYQDVNQSLS